MKYVYPAIFHPEKEGGFSIFFPDIEGCYTQGDTMVEAVEMAEDALNLMLWDKEENKEPIPHPSMPQDIRLASLYDDEALQGCTPQITAVSFDAEQLGRRTAQQLLSLIRHQPVETRTLLGYQVGLRLSTQT